MAIQLVRNQIVDSIINVDKLDNNAVSYAKINSSDIETTLTGGSSKLASAAAIKTYVDDAVTEITYQAGDGIDINTGTSPDTLSVDLASSSPGLYLDTNKLSVLLKAESGGTISKDASGLYIADSAIGNAKLANSSISGVALGSNLNALTAGDAISMTSYNGSAAVSDLTLVLDGSTLSKSGSGVKVADLGIDTAQIAQSAVTAPKVSFSPQLDPLTIQASTVAYNLSTEVPSGS